MNPVNSNKNYYEVLKISTNASKKEIKQAYHNFARQIHPDKKGDHERMVEINEAARVLLDESSKIDHDAALPRPISGYLQEGFRLSKVYEEKIADWTINGPATDQKQFRNPVDSIQPPEQSTSTLFGRNEQSVEDLLATVLPPAIWNWSHQEVNISISSELLNDPVWDAACSSNIKPSRADSSDFIGQLISVGNTPSMPITKMNNFGAVKAAKEFYSFEKKGIFSSFFRKKAALLPSGTKVHLLPKHLEPVFGHIPTATIQHDKKDYDSNCCAECRNSKSETYEYTSHPLYSEPVLIGSCCKQKLQDFREQVWEQASRSRAIRNVMTPEYLMVLNIVSTKPKSILLFELAHRFKIDKNHKMVFACLDLYPNTEASTLHWLNFANLYLKDKEYQLAMQCVDRIVESGFSYEDDVNYLLNKGSDLADLLLIFGIRTGFATPTKEELVQCSLKYKQFDIAAFVLQQNNASMEEWVRTINQLSYEDASSFILSMSEYLQCDWNSFQLRSEIDHLRWQFINPNFELDIGLDLLIQSIQRSNGAHSIPYFKSCFPRVNFALIRDQYFYEQDYTKALICHRLIENNRLTWQELAQKYEKRNESASLACCMAGSSNDANLGDELMGQKKTTLALMYYLQTNQVESIKEKGRTLDAATQLFFQVALWKQASQEESIIAICQLLTITNPKATYSKGAELQQLLKVISAFNLDPVQKKWFDETLLIVKVNLKKALRNAFQSQSWTELLPLLQRIQPLTVSAIKVLLRELNVDALPRGTQMSMGLIMRALVHLNDNAQGTVLDAMNDLTEAMLSHPFDECIACCSVIVQEISFRHKEGIDLRQSKIQELQLPKESRFRNSLVPQPDLRVLLKTEDNLKVIKPTPFLSAMMHIDLSMGMPEQSIMYTLLVAATEFYNVLQTLNATTDSSIIHAYKRAIVDLVVNSYYMCSRSANPITQMHVMRSGIAILTATFNKTGKVTKFEQEFIEDLYHNTQRLSKVAPLVFSKALSVYDTQLLNLVTGKLLDQYLPLQRDDQALEDVEDPKFQYFIFEGVVNRWLNDKKYQFDTERENTMKALLADKGFTMKDVEEQMNWPVLPRDAEGWYSKEILPLNLSGEQYLSVDSIAFNLKTGEIIYNLVGAPDGYSGWFDMSDIVQIVHQRGITGAEFTLNQPDPSMQRHPFQEQVYAPAQMAGTDYLRTLLHSDVLLKMMTTGIEISGKAPFKLRKADDHILRRLPRDLHEEMISLREKMYTSAESIYRFWITADKIDCHEKEVNGVVTVSFGECEMSVRSHRMYRDLRTGELTDVEKETEDDSPEGQFAAFLTRNYKKIGECFPELIRLQKLVEVQAMAVFAQRIYAAAQQKNANIYIEEANIHNYLINVREELKSKNLQYEWQMLDQISDNLKQTFHVKQDIVHTFRQIIAFDKDCGKLANILKTSQEKYLRDEVLRICKTFEKAGIATQLDSTPVPPTCSFVPAAISIDNKRRIYGGVNMNAKLNQVSEPPRNKKGRYMEGIWGNRVVGKIVVRNAATDVTHTALRLAKPLPNINKDVSGYWASAIGGHDPVRNVHHYTIHGETDTRHVHYDDGTAECIKKSGKRVLYKPTGKHSCKKDN